VNLANYLSERGWQVTIVTIANRKLDFYKTHRSVRLLDLDLDRNAPNLIIGMFNNVRRIVLLRRILREVEPDRAVGVISTAALTLLLASYGLRRIRVIVSERTYPPAIPLGRIWAAARRLVYPFAHCVVMQTSEGLDWLSREIPKARGAIIPNPIPYPLPDAEPTLLPEDWISPHRKLLLAVGRLSQEKGFDCLLEAFAKLAPENPEWDLVILGEGPQRDALENQAQVLRAAHRVHLPGRAGNVGDWYARADLYVMSSHFEGFPNTLGEAMAHRCAAISFDCDTGPRDLIRHGENGLLVKPVGDAQALASALRQLMQGGRQRTEMAAKATEVREQYSTDSIMKLWDQLFDF
jgi:glycosyltransferase involved in cell wall biosynthesis